MIIMCVCLLGCTQAKKNTSYEGTYQKDDIVLTIKKASDPQNAYTYSLTKGSKTYSDYALLEDNVLSSDLGEDGVVITFSLDQDIKVKVEGDFSVIEHIEGVYTKE